MVQLVSNIRPCPNGYMLADDGAANGHSSQPMALGIGNRVTGGHDTINRYHVGVHE